MFESTKIYPYVYLLTHKTTDKFYFGSRFSQGLRLPSHLDIQKYRSSAPKVKEHFDEYHCIIIAEFPYKEGGLDAWKFEQQLIHNNWANPLMINKCHHHNKGQFKFEKRTSETQTKFETTCLVRYGVNNPGKSKKSRDAARVRMLSCSNPGKNQSLETKTKIKISKSIYSKSLSR